MKLFWFLLVCLCSSFSYAFELTDEEQEWINHNQNFMFYNDDYDSRLFFIEDEEKKGLYSYLIKDINKKLNTEFTIEVKDVDVLHEQFNNLETGAYFDFANTKERRANYFFVPTLYRVSTKVYFKDTLNIEDLVS
ncbi:metal-dependent phosphohydrolase, partial [Aliivibrio sifiae]